MMSACYTSTYINRKPICNPTTKDYALTVSNVSSERTTKKLLELILNVILQRMRGKEKAKTKERYIYTIYWSPVYTG